MKKVRINSILINELEEKSFCDAIGIHETGENQIEYYDGGVFVVVAIDCNIVRMSRKHPEYELELNFKKNEVTKTQYHLKATDTMMDVEIKTTKLIIENNFIDIEYYLYLNSVSMGNFSYKVKFEEIEENEYNELHNDNQNSII